MKKRIIVLTLVTSVLFTACGNLKPTVNMQESVETLTDVETIRNDIETVSQETETTVITQEATEDIENAEVTTNDGDVVITIPAFLSQNSSKEDVDQMVVENAYNSGTLNSDNSITLVMTQEAQASTLAELETEMKEMLTSDDNQSDNPNLISITANDDYTEFVFLTTVSEVSDMDAFVMSLYMTMGMTYNIYAGVDYTTIDVVVKYVNPDTNEVIKSISSQEELNK